MSCSQSKVPILLESCNSAVKLEKPLMFVIDPDASLRYFMQAISKKLEYVGALKSKTKSLFYYCNGQQLSGYLMTMGDLFDKHRSAEGWLEIKVAGDSPF